MTRSNPKPPPHKGSKHPQENEHAVQESSTILPLVSEVVLSPRCKEETSICRPDQTPWWKMFVEVAAVIFGGCAVIIYYLQLDAAQRAMKLDERAWVSVTGAKLSRPYSADSKGIVMVHLANSGKTPALHMKIESAAFSDREDGVQLVPNVGAETVAPPGSKDDLIALAIRPGIPSDTKLFIRFVLTYRDVLQEPGDSPHTTTFCGFYPPDDSAEDRTTLMVCPNGGNSMN